MKPRPLPPRETAFERLPVHIQQALLIVAEIMKRIAAKRMAIKQQQELI